MALYCNYDVYDDLGDYYADSDDDFSTLDEERSCRCNSCGKKLHNGDTVLRFKCWRPPTEEEIDQYYDEEQEGGYDDGDVVPLPNEYFCESCGEICMNLTAIGYVFTSGDDMRESLREYHELTGFKPDKYKSEV